jgi:PKD repeat protein
MISEIIIDTNIWVGDTESPVADAGQDLKANVGESVLFEASNSHDNIGIAIYEWDFGDGSTGAGMMATHTYTDLGSYMVSLTVWDAAGNSDTDTIRVDIEEGGDLAPVLAASIILALVVIVGVLFWMWNKPKRRRQPKRRR